MSNGLLVFFQFWKNLFTFLKCWPSMDWEPVSCGLCVGGRHIGAAAGCQKPGLPGLRLFNRLGHLFLFSFWVFSFSWRRKKLSCLICTHLFNRSACSGGKFCHCYLHWSHALQTPLMENWNVPSWTERMIYTGIEPLGRVDCHACLSFAKSLQYKLQQSSPLQLNLTWLLSSALPIIFKVSHSLKSVREANQWISPVPQSKTSPVWFVKPAAGSLFHPPLLLYCIHKSLLKRGSNGRVVNIHKFMS